MDELQDRSGRLELDDDDRRAGRGNGRRGGRRRGGGGTAAAAAGGRRRSPRALSRGPGRQIMHVGPYSEEAPTIERLHAFVEEQGYELHGRHHEIYLGDPRRTAPERLKTVIRHPVRPRR